MIQGIIGLPGAGKTTVLAAACQKWINGKTFLDIRLPEHKLARVYSNFPCPGCYELDFASLGLRYYHDCIIVIDEIALFADSRDFKNFAKHTDRFMRLHRHANIDIVWCSQTFDCDKKIRNLTDKMYILDRGSGPLSSFTFVKPIQRSLNANSESFKVLPPVQWWFIYRPKWYGVFDSFAHDFDKLPDPDNIPWNPSL